MGRPRKDVETQIEDLFFDCSLELQERLLRMLEKLHRLKARQDASIVRTDGTLAVPRV